MLLQPDLSKEHLLTNFTLMMAIMLLQVMFQIIRLREFVLAYITLIAVGFTTVLLHMPHQNVWMCKHFLTNIAFICTLSAVFFHVPHKELRVCKYFLTNITSVAFF